MEAAYDIKVILLGESDVGKTSLILQFVENKFKNSLSKTVIDHTEKVIKIGDKLVKLTLWDTAGREAYYRLVKSYYKVADGLLLVYDVQNVKTFSALSKWLKDFKLVNENAEILIAGNKADDEIKELVCTTEMKGFVQKEKIDCIEVSAKSGRNVNTLFHHLVQNILVARGFLPYSKDSCLTGLEKYEAHTDISSIITTPESLATCVKSTEEKSINIMDCAPKNITNESFITNDVQDDDDDSSSGDYGFVFYSFGDMRPFPGEDSLSVESAESAVSFFEKLGENVSVIHSK